MGSWFSSQKTEKNVENNGQVSNNIVIEDAVQINNFEITLMLLIIVILKFIEFICFIYRIHLKRMKRKYQVGV